MKYYANNQIKVINKKGHSIFLSICRETPLLLTYVLIHSLEEAEQQFHTYQHNLDN